MDGPVLRTYPVCDRRAPPVYYPESRTEIAAAVQSLYQYVDFNSRILHDPNSPAALEPCGICGTTESLNDIVTCPGCQYSFHASCLDHEESGSDWFMCPSCDITTFVRNESSGAISSLDQVILGESRLRNSHQHLRRQQRTVASNNLVNERSDSDTHMTQQGQGNAARMLDYDENYDEDFDTMNVDVDEDDDNNSQDLFVRTSHHTGSSNGGTLRLTSGYISSRPSRPLRFSQQPQGSSLSTGASSDPLTVSPSVRQRQTQSSLTRSQMPEEELSWRLFDQARAIEQRTTVPDPNLNDRGLVSTSIPEQTGIAHTLFATPSLEFSTSGSSSSADLGIVNERNGNVPAIFNNNPTNVSVTAPISSSTGDSTGQSLIQSGSCIERGMGNGAHADATASTSSSAISTGTVPTTSTAANGRNSTSTSASAQEAAHCEGSGIGNTLTSGSASIDIDNGVHKKLKRPNRRRQQQVTSSTAPNNAIFNPSINLPSFEVGPSVTLSGFLPNTDLSQVSQPQSSEEPTQIQMLLTSIRQSHTIYAFSSSPSLSSSASMTNLSTAMDVTSNIELSSPHLKHNAELLNMESSSSSSSSSPIIEPVPIRNLQSELQISSHLSDGSQKPEQPLHLNSDTFSPMIQLPQSELPRPVIRKKGRAPPLSKRDKERLQELVRDILRPLYQTNKITKDEYTEINKRVSRIMYQHVFREKVVKTKSKGSNQHYEKMKVQPEDGTMEDEERFSDTGDTNEEDSRKIHRSAALSSQKSATVYIIKYTFRDLERWKELASNFVDRERRRRTTGT